MTRQHENRVLVRRGARLLTIEELENVNAGGLRTGAPCSFDPKSGSLDGPPADC